MHGLPPCLMTPCLSTVRSPGMKKKKIFENIVGIIWMVALFALIAQSLKANHTNPLIRFIDICTYFSILLIALVLAIDSPKTTRKLAIITGLLGTIFFLLALILPRILMGGGSPWALSLSVILILIDILGLLIFYKNGFLISDNIR